MNRCAPPLQSSTAISRNLRCGGGASGFTNASPSARTGRDPHRPHARRHVPHQHHQLPRRPPATPGLTSPHCDTHTPYGSGADDGDGVGDRPTVCVAVALKDAGDAERLRSGVAAREGESVRRRPGRTSAAPADHPVPATGTPAPPPTTHSPLRQRGHHEGRRSKGAQHGPSGARREVTTGNRLGPGHAAGDLAAGTADGGDKPPQRVARCSAVSAARTTAAQAPRNAISCSESCLSLSRRVAVAGARGSQLTACDFN